MGEPGSTPRPRLIATFIYLASVEHEIVGSGVWDYQLWNDSSPVRVYEDGRRVPLDVYQRLVNANFNLNVRRTMLLDDFSGLALDEPGRERVRPVPSGSARPPARARPAPPAPWRMEPKRLKANINA